jgi:spore coat polysaccharide biosynthesis predicted glycosyltransferase SpsG
VGHDLNADVVVVADGGAGSGLGHLSRSGAVSSALRARGRTVACFALGADEVVTHDVEWLPAALLRECAPPRLGGAVVLDSYRTPMSEALRFAGGTHLVVMHDRGEAIGDAEVVVSLTGEPGAGLLAGPAYACLRPAFWGLPTAVESGDVESVLVTTGAGEAPFEIAAAIKARLPGIAVSAVVGPFAAASSFPTGIHAVVAMSSLLEALRMADVVVTAGGQTLLEALACGKPTVAIVTAENQQEQVQFLATNGAAVAIDPPSPFAVAEAVARLVADHEKRRQISISGRELVDGFGALRVGFAIDQLIAERA